MAPLTPPTRAVPGNASSATTHSNPTSPLLLPTVALPPAHAFPTATSNTHKTNGYSGPIDASASTSGNANGTNGAYSTPSTPQPAAYGRNASFPINGYSQSTMSNAPTSQLAWLASLTTSFNDFTEEQKFQRKVSPKSGPISGCCRDQGDDQARARDCVWSMAQLGAATSSGMG